VFGRTVSIRPPDRVKGRLLRELNPRGKAQQAGGRSAALPLATGYVRPENGTSAAAAALRRRRR